MQLSFFKLMIFVAAVALTAPAWSARRRGAERRRICGSRSTRKPARRRAGSASPRKTASMTDTIVKIFPKPGDDPNQKWVCNKCEGEEHGAPVLGLALIKGMRRNGLAYENGTIMDPRDGTVYRALMKLSPDGKQLEVRGFLGISLFGRSQIWNRLPDNAMATCQRRTDAPRKKVREGQRRRSAVGIHQRDRSCRPRRLRSRTPAALPVVLQASAVTGAAPACAPAPRRRPRSAPSARCRRHSRPPPPPASGWQATTSACASIGREHARRLAHRAVLGLERPQDRAGSSPRSRATCRRRSSRASAPRAE